MIKIAFIGAGSMVFTRCLIRDILSYPALAGATIALMDIDQERLGYAKTAVESLIAAGNYPAKIQATLSRAEALKVTEGSCVYEDVPPGEMVRVEDDTGYVLGEVERAFLNEVIYLRVREIMEQVYQRCEGHIGRLAAGVYLTGGSSLLKGIDVVAREVFGMKVTRSGSAPVSGVTATFENPQFSAPIGLIRYAQILDQEKPFLSPLKRLAHRMADLLSVAL